jgi:hypothetical protein
VGWAALAALTNIAPWLADIGHQLGFAAATVTSAELIVTGFAAILGFGAASAIAFDLA